LLGSNQPGFGKHRDKEQELGPVSDIQVCALTVFMKPHLDVLWYMECCSAKNSTKSVVLQLRDGTFAFQLAGAQVSNTHQSYGPQLQAPRYVIIFRKVLEDVYLHNKHSQSLNKQHRESWYTYEELQQEIVGNNTTTKYVFFLLL
jgi:hypothetical protein